MPDLQHLLRTQLDLLTLLLVKELVGVTYLYSRYTQKGTPRDKGHRKTNEKKIKSYFFFEIPDVLKLASDNNINVQIKINQRPKFKISDKRLKIAENLYEKYKTKSSKFVIAN